VQAIAELDELSEALGLTLQTPDDEEDVTTLGGLVVMLAGYVPARGEVIESPDGLRFEVIEADPRRIKRLRIRLPEAVPTPASA
jgi:magnesium and cobalt transporter